MKGIQMNDLAKISTSAIFGAAIAWSIRNKLAVKDIQKYHNLQQKLVSAQHHYSFSSGWDAGKRYNETHSLFEQTMNSIPSPN